MTPAIKNCIIIGFSLAKHHLEFDLTNGEISTPHLINLTPRREAYLAKPILKISVLQNQEKLEVNLTYYCLTVRNSYKKQINRKKNI